MDGRINLASNDPNNAVYAFNLVPSEFGLRTREGYREWQIDIESGVGLGFGVRTILPFHGDTEDGTKDKIFVCTNEGIWDVTIDGGTPVLDAVFADQSDDAGWGVFTHYTTDAGLDIMFVADSANGLYTYDPVGDVWAPTVGITGPVIADIVYIIVHKQRIWLIEKNSTSAWYLDPGAIAGAATQFHFGTKFKHGGDLVGLYNWTQDGGAGTDDYLVAVGRAGDVIPWEGADPAFAVSWQDIGTFYIGDIPLGRRIASEYGGDMMLLSDFGLTSMADLTQGVSTTPRAQSLPLKIARFIRTDMDTLATSRGWEIRLDSNEGILLIGTPRRVNGEYLQYRVNLATDAWAFWRGVPMLTSNTWHGAQMFGTLDNRIMRMDVSSDDLTIAGSEGDAIEFSILTNYNDLGSPGIHKYGEFTRPNFVSTLEPSFETRISYDYATTELPASEGLPQPGSFVWDVAKWDQALWSSSQIVPFTKLQGSWGPGRTIAIALRGTARARTTLASVDVLWRDAGPF